MPTKWWEKIISLSPIFDAKFKKKKTLSLRSCSLKLVHNTKKK